MKKKYSFPALNCWSCAEHRTTGNLVSETRYCMGFPKKKNGKRFKQSDPKYKAPKWCPKRLASPVCRIYSFADECSAALDRLLRSDDSLMAQDYAYPRADKYTLRLELPLGLTAKEFWERVEQETAEYVLMDADLAYGDVVEIDDGLKPHYFYYTYGSLIPVGLFHAELTVKPEHLQQKQS